MAPEDPIRIAFAGDRDVAVRCLRFVLDEGVKPEALIVSTTRSSSHAEELTGMCSFLDDSRILAGPVFREPAALELLDSLELDYIVCVHFPYIVPEQMLAIPKIGVLNVHPAFLPFNRGWHTPTWAILDRTPLGATLHFMNREVDEGDIAHQKQLAVLPYETADDLYRRVKDLEFEVFVEAWPDLLRRRLARRAQERGAGSHHKPADLFDPGIQEIRADEFMRARDLIDRLRALTTNSWQEAAYMVVDGLEFRLRVEFGPPSEDPD